MFISLAITQVNVLTLHGQKYAACKQRLRIVQLTGAIEYTECSSAEELKPAQRVSWTWH